MGNKFIVKIQMSLNPKETSVSQSKWELSMVFVEIKWNSLKITGTYMTITE